MNKLGQREILHLEKQEVVREVGILRGWLDFNIPGPSGSVEIGRDSCWDGSGQGQD